MFVVGRGRLRVVKRIFPHEAILRLDDGRNDEFWAEVHLSREDLVSMLADLDEANQQEKNHEAL